MDAPEKHLASKGCDQEHEADDAYQGVQTKIVHKRSDRRSSGSIPINQCHVPINHISLGRGETLLRNTKGGPPKSRRDI